jgi:hypothetical protein
MEAYGDGAMTRGAYAVIKYFSSEQAKAPRIDTPGWRRLRRRISG